MQTAYFRWSDVGGKLVGGVRRSQIDGVGADIKRIEIPAGTRAARHSHAHEQFLIVESGLAQLTTAAGTMTLEPGVVVRFAPEAWHEALFERDTVLLEVNLRQ